MNELLELILISIGVGALSQLSYWLLTDRKKVKELKAKINEYNQKLKSIKRESEEFTKAYSEYLSITSELLKENLKPTIYTFVPFLILFFVLEYYFAYVPIHYNQQITFINSSTFSSTCSLSHVSANKYLLNVSNCEVLVGNETINVSSLLGKFQVQKYKGGEFIPQELGVNSPIGFINWFWIYFIVTFITSIVLSNVFERIF